MWLFTNFGFFSIVQKPKQDFLTVRARTASDLERMRDLYLPELSETITGAGTDYPFRATISHKAFAEGLGRIVQDLKYSNFKSEVEKRMGHKRAKTYSKVWGDLLDLEDDHKGTPSPTKSTKTSPKRLSYGGVVINEQDQVLLREPKNHFDGYVWTFPKGSPEPGETPEKAALREVAEETGIVGKIFKQIPGKYAGGTTENIYFLMGPSKFHAFSEEETQSVRWADQREAEKLIGMTTNALGRDRDLRVLRAAFELHSRDRKQFVQAMTCATRKDWQTKRMPKERVVFAFDRTFAAEEMDRMKRGVIPEVMEDKWFVFSERNRLYFHRSWTGYCVYIVEFKQEGDRFKVSEVIANRNKNQYRITDNDEDARLLSFLIDILLLDRHPEFPGIGGSNSPEENAIREWSLIGRKMMDHQDENEGQ